MKPSPENSEITGDKKPEKAECEDENLVVKRNPSGENINKFLALFAKNFTYDNRNDIINAFLIFKQMHMHRMDQKTNPSLAGMPKITSRMQKIHKSLTKNSSMRRLKNYWKRQEVTWKTL